MGRTGGAERQKRNVGVKVLVPSMRAKSSNENPGLSEWSKSNPKHPNEREAGADWYTWKRRQRDHRGRPQGSIQPQATEGNGHWKLKR